jgi:hypothetical protein
VSWLEKGRRRQHLASQLLWCFLCCFSAWHFGSDGPGLWLGAGGYGVWALLQIQSGGYLVFLALINVHSVTQKHLKEPSRFFPYRRDIPRRTQCILYWICSCLQSSELLQLVYSRNPEKQFMTSKQTSALTDRPGGYKGRCLKSRVIGKFGSSRLKLPQTPAVSTGRCNTPSDMNSISKGGVYGTRKTEQAFH